MIVKIRTSSDQVQEATLAILADTIPDALSIAAQAAAEPSRLGGRFVDEGRPPVYSVKAFVVGDWTPDVYLVQSGNGWAVVTRAEFERRSSQ